MNNEHGREFDFTEQDFQRIRKLIRDYAGIALGDSKQELVYSRLARRLRATGSRTFAEYLDRLQCGGDAEWEAFTNALTTNHTITLWCSACSTGEEAYSMAITAVETLGSERPVHIIASDLDTGVLQTARAGRYKAEAVARMPPQQVERFFTRGSGGDAGYVQVKPDLMRLIDFRRFNLLDPGWPIHAPLDAIFCRNVMIYFDKETQLAVLKKFAPLLRQDGLLFAGHSESFYHAASIFKLRGNTVYELAGKGA
jgi:chemotaxis protein methyltransferase CheR